MVLRRIFLSLCVLAGLLVFATVFLRALALGQTDFWPISLRAVIAGGATMLGAALFTGLIQRLGGPEETPAPAAKQPAEQEPGITNRESEVRI